MSLILELVESDIVTTLCPCVGRGGRSSRIGGLYSIWKKLDCRRRCGLGSFCRVSFGGVVEVDVSL